VSLEQFLRSAIGYFLARSGSLLVAAVVVTCVSTRDAAGSEGGPTSQSPYSVTLSAAIVSDSAKTITLACLYGNNSTIGALGQSATLVSQLDLRIQGLDIAATARPDHHGIPLESLIAQRRHFAPNQGTRRYDSRAIAQVAVHASSLPALHLGVSDASQPLPNVNSPLEHVSSGRTAGDAMTSLTASNAIRATSVFSASNIVEPTSYLTTSPSHLNFSADGANASTLPEVHPVGYAPILGIPGR
jgi:hypothetical protein